ncbi:MAG: hypothetical protein R2789_12035 [Microthrixaceae bacterium]
MWFFCGAKVILHEGSFDPVEVWRTIEREKVSTTTVVGDAMARPLADAWDSDGPFGVSSLFAFSNGAPLAESTKARLMEMLPNCVFTDGFGSSETGIQGSSRLAPGEKAGGTAVFASVAEGPEVFDENDRRSPRDRAASVGSPTAGSFRCATTMRPRRLPRRSGRSAGGVG